jgi:hypothetical protein
VGAFVWVDLAAAALLALWVTLRYPDARPRSVSGALLVFGMSQLVAQLGVSVMRPLVQVTEGAQLALVVVVLPVLFAIVISSFWLLRTVVDAFHGPASRHARI